MRPRPPQPSLLFAKPAHGNLLGSSSGFMHGMAKPPASPLFRILIALSVIFPLFTLSIARGQLTSFDPIQNLQWSEPANWSHGIPTATMTFKLPGQVPLLPVDVTAIIDGFDAVARAGFIGRFPGERGRLIITNNGTLTMTDLLDVGWEANAQLIITDGGNLTTDSLVAIGWESNSLFTISDGGSASVARLQMSIAHGSRGEITVSGANSTLRDVQLLHSGFNGNLTVSNGGIAQIALITLGHENSGPQAHTIHLLGTPGARGVLEVGAFTHRNGLFTLNWNGGILRATADQSEYFTITSTTATTSIQLGAGGGFFDTNGFNVATAASFSGTGSLTKIGTGTLTLTGIHTHTGGTVVEEGRLLVNGTLGDVIIAPNGILGGTGSVGALTLHGGILSPGNSAGTLTAEAFTWDSGVIEFTLGPPSDFLHVNGHFSGSGPSLLFTFNGFGWTPGATYDLIGFQTTTFSDPSIFGFTNSDIQGFFTLGADRLQFTIIPEPGTTSLLILALLAASFRRNPKCSRRNSTHPPVLDYL